MINEKYKCVALPFQVSAVVLDRICILHRLPIIATDGQIFIYYLLYLGQVLRPHIGLTHTRPLSCGFDSSVGRALHRHRRGRGFESRSEPDFFSGFCSSVRPHLHSSQSYICIYRSLKGGILYFVDLWGDRPQHKLLSNIWLSYLFKLLSFEDALTTSTVTNITSVQPLYLVHKN